MSTEPFVPKFKLPPPRPRVPVAPKFPASFAKRASAWCLDILPFQLIAALFGIGSFSMPIPTPGSDGMLNVSMSGVLSSLWSAFLWCLVLWVLYAFYVIVCEALYQTTPGKYLVGLKVVRKNSRQWTWTDALLRFGAASLSWLTLNVGHAMMHYRKDHAALHDLITQTQVLDDSNVTLGDLPKLSPTHHLYGLIAGFAIQGCLFLWGTVHLLSTLNTFAQQALQGVG